LIVYLALRKPRFFVQSIISGARVARRGRCGVPINRTMWLIGNGQVLARNGGGPVASLGVEVVPTSAGAGIHGPRQRPPDAVVPVGGIVQPIPGDQRARREPGVDRASHQRKTRKQADPLLPRRFGNG
jgi:hypothetical protein